MAAPDEQIIIELVVRLGHPALLDGLDSWLRLGLISDDFVRRFCQRELTCPLPDPVAITDDLEVDATESAARLQSTGAFLPVSSDDFSRSERPSRRGGRPVSAQTSQARSPNLISQALQSFMAEISVVWLLFLGVFLVVVSSGVLAATQWRNVPPAGQYSILLGYTLIFCLASLWTARKPTLQITSRMLAIATLLIVPVNFWMIDGFRLWNSPVGVSIAAIAALILTVILVILLRPNSSVLSIGTAIALSWLNLGWNQAGIPFAAAYIGTVGATAVLLREDRRTVNRQISADELESQATREPILDLSTIAIAFSVLLLVARAVFVAQVSLNQLALAIGLCGWLLCWLARRTRTRIGWAWAGGGLLLTAWLVAFQTEPPWQAFLVSGLALWLLVDALQRTGKTVFLPMGFLVGLQMVWLSWYLFPFAWREQVLTLSVQLAGNAGMPYVLTGLGFFPYIVLMLGLAVQLRRWQRPVLANQAEVLTLALGGLLTAVSVGNPLVRSLNLTLSTLTLGVIVFKRSRLPAAVTYLAHAATLATLFSWIDKLAPALGVVNWTVILLIVTTIEWLLSGVFWQMEPRSPDSIEQVSDARERSELGISNQQRTLPARGRQNQWFQSGWHLGLVLAGISYLLLWQFPGGANTHWRLIWLIVPILLTGLNYRDRFPQSRLAGWFGALALVLFQGVTLGLENERLVSLGTATVLMLFNTYRLPYFLSTLITVGFSLAFWGAIVWKGLLLPLESQWLMPLLAFTLVGLWGVRGGLQRKRGNLARFYRSALDAWAIAVLLLAFLVFTLLQAAIYWQWATAVSQHTLACGLLVLAIAYRNWQASSNGGWWALAWSVELLIASSLSLAGRSWNDLAIANLALGMVSQLLGDWWMARRRANPLAEDSNPELDRFPWSWHGIPLAYAVLGVALHHQSFTAATGLYTLVGALVLLGVGRRQPELKPLSYLALLMTSLAAYEGLLYQLSQMQGDNAGDGIVLLAALASVLAILYRLLQRWLMPYTRLTRVELQGVAHVHWGLGYVFLVLAAVASLSLTGQWIWAAISMVLAVYALGMGNQRWTEHRDPIFGASGWTYAGIGGLLIAIAACLRLLLPDAQLIDWAGAIASVIAVGFYFGPWSRWGWPQAPWQRSAAGLPLLAVFLTFWGDNVQSLLITASFYAWLASAKRQIRFSYVSVLLADWAILRLFHTYQLREVFWYALVLGGSLLYLAQVDPTFHAQQNREQRHWLRSLATGLVCFTIFYQSQVGIAGVAPITVGFLAIAVEFGFILMGLLQKVRAFLYIGTLTFVIQILWQLWRFISDYSLLLWMFGIILGLILIWVAATFEARRAQVNSLLQHWIAELDGWS